MRTREATEVGPEVTTSGISESLRALQARTSENQAQRDRESEITIRPPVPSAVLEAIKQLIKPSMYPLLQVLALYMIVRVGLFLAEILLSHLTFQGHLVDPIEGWDSSAYLRIASHGYPRNAIKIKGVLTYNDGAFFPVFPFLIRMVSFLGLTVLQAGIIVSLIGGAVSAVLAWKIAGDLYGPEVAWIAAVLFCLFPGMAVSWGLIYSESVGIAFVAGALLLMLRKQWVWAGVVGAFATATSPLAVPLIGAAFLVGIIALVKSERPVTFITGIISSVGVVGFIVLIGERMHDLFFWFDLEKQAWGSQIDFGTGLLGQLPHFWASGNDGRSWMELLAIFAVLGSLVALARARMPAVLTSYTLFSLLFLFIGNNLGFKPRLLTWAFPALIAIAFATRRKGWQFVAISFAILLPIVFLFYAGLGDISVQP
jgi:hypothetical protein